jgi:hypothetical protein
MKYIYILALIVFIIISCFLTVENFSIPTAAMNSLFRNNDDAVQKRTITVTPGDTSDEKIKGMLNNAPSSGVSTGLGSIEKREQEFEKEDEKCRAVTFCENFHKETNCGYCLQDDLEGNHSFHYGNEEGAFLKRDGGAQSLCKSGPNRDKGNVWVPPAIMNGKKQQALEEEEMYIKNKYPDENHPDRQQALIDIQKRKSEAVDLENTGSSGCTKMRERYVCGQVEDCFPMNITMFGIKAKDICGFCADDSKAYVRMDLPDNSETYNETRYKSDPKCNNIEIFGDGVNCSTYHKDRDGCLSKKSLEDPNINACAYNYNNKSVVVPITIPKPSNIKYLNNDKCDSEWGLIRPSQCEWFEEQYPCLKSKSGGPHSEKCLVSLWRQMGFTTSYRELASNGEQELINSWEKMDINRVQESMQSIYEKIYSQKYDVAKKWAKICFGLKVNDCNRAGFINDAHPNQYWSSTSDPCMSKLYRYGGGREAGLANPEKSDSMGYGLWGQLKEGFKEGYAARDKFYKAMRPGGGDFQENETEQEIHGSEGGFLATLKLAKEMSQKDYIKMIRNLNKTKDIGNSEAKKVYNKNNLNQWINKPSFSNARWVDKLVSSKLITGSTPDYPVDENKLCWPEFARRMLIHPYVKLNNLKTLSFINAAEFHVLSHVAGNSVSDRNSLKAGNRFYERDGGTSHGYSLSQDTYDQDTFPFWKWLEISRLYWKDRWAKFKNILLDYEDVGETTYRKLMRTSHVNEAKQFAEGIDLPLGGNGYGFSGGYGTKGLYSYTDGVYKGNAYFGTGGDSVQNADEVSYPKYRLDNNVGMQVLLFKPKSRFYNSLPPTSDMNKAMSEPYFYEFTNHEKKKVRVLFSQAYHKDNYPYYDLLKFTIKN